MQAFLMSRAHADDSMSVSDALAPSVDSNEVVTVEHYDVSTPRHSLEVRETASQPDSPSPIMFAGLGDLSDTQKSGGSLTATSAGNEEPSGVLSPATSPMAPADPTLSRTLSWTPAHTATSTTNDFNAFEDARAHSYGAQFRNLASRPEAAHSSVAELVAALKATGGLVNSAKRLLWHEPHP